MTDTYAQVFANRHPATGLLSNEADEWGNIVRNYPVVDYNGARTPWRMVTDYIWWGAPEAKDVADKMTDWAARRGVGSLVDGLMVDGSSAPGHNWTRSNPFTGAWAAGAMSHCRLGSTSSPATSQLQPGRRLLRDLAARPVPADAERQHVAALGQVSGRRPALPLAAWPT